MINLSNTTPAAPTAAVNVTWQNDVSGDVSAYVPTTPTKTQVTPASGVVTINAGLGNSFFVTINQAVTSTVISNPTDGQEITILWAQGATAYAVALATNMLGAIAVTVTANKHTCHKLTYNAADGNWYTLNANNM